MFRISTIILLVVVILQGCKPSVKTDLYIQDLYDVLETKKTVEVPAVIGIEIQDAKKCDEAKNKIVPILSRYLNGLKFIECKKIKGSMTDKMYVETNVQIVVPNKDGVIENWKGLFTFVIFDHPFGIAELFQLFILRSDNLKSLEKELDKMFQFQSVVIEDVDISVKINNDTRKDVEIKIGGAFVNGKPVSRGYPYKIARREFLNVKPSDVKTGVLLSKGYASFGYFAKQGNKLPDAFRTVPLLGGSTPWDGK